MGGFVVYDHVTIASGGRRAILKLESGNLVVDVLQPDGSPTSWDTIPDWVWGEIKSRGLTYHGPQPDSTESLDLDESWSQGRLAPERLSLGQGAHYIHEYLRVATIAGRKVLGMGTAQEKASPYDVETIEAHLNYRAKDGWRLVSMEPHWWYERQAISGAMSITRPLAIVGWYLTFERGE